MDKDEKEKQDEILKELLEEEQHWSMCACGIW